VAAKTGQAPKKSTNVGPITTAQQHGWRDNIYIERTLYELKIANRT